MIPLSRAALPILVVAALAATAGAEHCEGWGNEPDFTYHPFYVDNDWCQIDCASSVWVYQESNGIDGLQRGDAVVDETCHGTIQADTILVSGYA